MFVQSHSLGKDCTDEPTAHQIATKNAPSAATQYIQRLREMSSGRKAMPTPVNMTMIESLYCALSARPLNMPF